MKRFVTCTIFVFTFLISFCQFSTHEYEKEIDTIDLYKHLSILASDSLQGRNTGEEGQKMAAEYIRSVYKQLGLSYAPMMSSYNQAFDLYAKMKNGTMTIGTKSLTFPNDFGFLSFFQPHTFSYNSLVFVEDPSSFNFQQKELKSAVLLVEINSLQEYDKTFWNEVKCKAIFFVVKKYDSRFYVNYSDKGLILPNPKASTPHIFLNKKSLGKKFKWNEKLVFAGKLNQDPIRVMTENLIAYIEGTDKNLKKEVIVISAHYDHVGVENGQVFNGADDNGTGTSALLEIAQALQQAKNDGHGLKRSVLFIAMTGEEMGLLGSSFYADNPVIPMGNTITDLNIDMIGRTTKESEKDTFSVFIIGSNMLSNDLHNLNEQANKEFTKLHLDYEYNRIDHPLKLYFRSDHYNFAKFGVPSIFYFGGFHDDYHKATDDIEKINFQKLNQVTKLVFHTCVLLGNANKRPNTSM
jgi:hypothetical protein